MPRIPAAIAVVALLALCIAFNVAYYPAVRRMAPACGLSMPSLGAKEAAPAASIPGSGGSPAAFCTAEGVCYDAGGKPLAGKADAGSPKKPSSPSPAKRAAGSPQKAESPPRRTDMRGQEAEGPPRNTAGAARPEKPIEGPVEAKPPVQYASPAAENSAAGKKSFTAGKSDVADSALGAAAEPPLIPAIRRPLPSATPGGKPAAELASVSPPASPTPLGREAPAAKRIERLPPADEMAAAGAAALEPALPPDTIPIYPTTPVP